MRAEALKGHLDGLILATLAGGPAHGYAIAQTLRGRLARLANSPPGVMPVMAMTVPDPQRWSLESLCERDEDGRHARLLELLQQCIDASFRLSDDLSARYFAHSSDARYSVGA